MDGRGNGFSPHAYPSRCSSVVESASDPSSLCRPVPAQRRFFPSWHPLKAKEVSEAKVPDAKQELLLRRQWTSPPWGSYVRPSM